MGFATGRLWILSAFLILVFAIGGGARADIASLMVLRPVAVLVAAYGLATVRRAQLCKYRVVAGLVFAVVLLHIVQLLPLPPGLWVALPGREAVAEIDRLAGLGAVWRPMTMTPYATWNSLWSLSVPIAVLLLAMQLDGRERLMLVLVFIGLCFASFFLGVLQLFGNGGDGFYFYRVTNPDAAVGLFANRSHNALFLVCGLAMLLSWGFGRTTRGLVEICVIAGLAVLLVLQIVLTGSRTGAALGLAVIVAAPIVLNCCPSARTVGSLRLWSVSAGLVGLVALAVLEGRGLAVERMLSDGLGADMRVRALPTIATMVGEYAPWGAGFGSFDQVFRVHEPRGLVAPSYFNHAHNDWMEVALGGGLPAMLLLAGALAWFGRQMVRVFRGGTSQDSLLGRLGAVILMLFALASASDYPLRVPSLLSMAVVACVWMTSDKLPFDNVPVRKSEYPA